MFQKTQARFYHLGHEDIKGMKVLFQRFTSVYFATSAVYFSNDYSFFPLIPAEKGR
jgi:hypothetical protein